MGPGHDDESVDERREQECSVRYLNGHTYKLYFGPMRARRVRILRFGYDFQFWPGEDLASRIRSFPAKTENSYPRPLLAAAKGRVKRIVVRVTTRPVRASRNHECSGGCDLVDKIR